MGDYFFNQGNFDQASDWYGGVLRKEKLKNFSRETSQVLPNASEVKEVFVKFGKACLRSADFHFDQGRKYSSSDPDRAEMELREVFRLYGLFIRSISNEPVGGKFYGGPPGFTADLSGLVRKAGADLAEIYKLKKPWKILELYTTFLGLTNISGDTSFAEKGAKILSSAPGVNLLDNPWFADSDGNGVPDGYTFACVGPKATYPDKEIIKTDQFSTYHVWQKGGNGWFATSFQIGRVPPNTFFTYSIEIKRIDTRGEARPMLFTTRSSNPEWGSGSDYSEIGLVKDMRDGWKREFHTIKTDKSHDIMLSGWLVAWHYGQAEGQIYVRNPKVEIGNRATFSGQGLRK